MSNAGTSGVEARPAGEGSELSAKLQSSQWRAGDRSNQRPRHAEADCLLIQSAVPTTTQSRNPQSFALASSKRVAAAVVNDTVNITVFASSLLAGSTSVDRQPRRNEPYMSCGDVETVVAVESRLYSLLYSAAPALRDS